MAGDGELWEAEVGTRSKEAPATWATQVTARTGSRLMGTCDNVITTSADNNDGCARKGWWLGTWFDWLPVVLWTERLLAGSDKADGVSNNGSNGDTNGMVADGGASDGLGSILERDEDDDYRWGWQLDFFSFWYNLNFF